MKRLLILFILIAPIGSRAQGVQEDLEKIILEWISSNVADTCTVSPGKFDPHTIRCSNEKEEKWIWSQMIYARSVGDKRTEDSLKVHYDAFRCDTIGYQVWYEFSYLSKEKKQFEVLLSATTDRTLIIEEILYYDPEGLTEIPARDIYKRRKEAGPAERKEK